MAHLILRPEWHLPERLVTPEASWRSRRRFLRALGIAGAGALAAGPWLSSGALAADAKGTNAPGAGTGASPRGARYPAPRNPDFNPGWRLTKEDVASSYNNFYEFSLDKERVRDLTGRFVTTPWPIEISGLIEKPMTIDAAELAAEFGLEERVYRFRCVEAWSMVVPWTGFPLRRLIDKVSPKPEARFIRFQTFHRPEQAPGFARLPEYPWPYTEGLRLDEARHPLTMLATGIYGKPMPKQHGAPIRLVVPWKYGYKSIKSIVKIEFVARQPATFWETLAPEEYPFESNVNPKVPHPRWSQAFERVIDTDDRIRTLPFNGYASEVAALYPARRA